LRFRTVGREADRGVAFGVRAAWTEGFPPGSRTIDLEADRGVAFGVRAYSWRGYFVDKKRCEQVFYF
jgi:hypothetical protein